jgi:RNA polymerase sigma factor (sigma-70 family)
MTTLTTEERNSLILNNVLLAENIAKSKKKKLTQVSFDELKSAAYLGLVEAASHYDPLKNDCFPAYAVWRIIGSIRDYLRELSWGPRSKPIKMNDFFVHQECFFIKQEQFDFSDFSCFFEIIIDQLPIVNKTVLKLYYQENKKIKEIANDLSVHQSRVSQILSESRVKLKNIWKSQQAELWSIAA